MPVFLLKIVFLVLSTVSYFVSRFIFSTIAYLLVFFIQALKVPGENAKGLLEQVTECLKGFFEYFMDLAVEAITTVISLSFDLFKEGVMGSATMAIAAILSLVEQTRTSFEGLVKDLPELFEGFSEMVSTIVTDLWNNYKDALGYVKESISS